MGYNNDGFDDFIWDDFDWDNVWDDYMFNDIDWENTPWGVIIDLGVTPDDLINYLIELVMVEYQHLIGVIL